MNELNGGYVTGDGELLDAGEGSENRGRWNDHTQSWEKVGESRRAQAYGLVQQRIGYADFSRQYEHYVSAAAARDAASRLQLGDDRPEADR